jgi:hypothetical protein
MAAQILPLFADNLTQPLLDFRVVDIIVVDPALVTSVIWRINVPTDFDTKGKALSGAKAAEKGLKRGLPR